MKKILLIAALFCSAHAFANPTVDQKVLEAFRVTFTNAQEVSWSAMGELYEVKFKHNDVRTAVTYDTDGQIVKTLRYYYEDKLPVMLLTRVKTRFAGKTVFGITEVCSESGTFYHIILEDAKSWTNIVADSYGNMSVEKKMTKA